MKHYKWEQVQNEQLTPLFARRVIHSDRMTVGRIHLAKGCIVPEHTHENEQISMVERGELRFSFPGETLVVKAGEALAIPSHVPHSVEALEDSLAIDVFAPAREDWIRGDDAYLRSARK